MKVKVELYGTLRRFSQENKKGLWVGDIPTGSTINDLLDIIGISKQEVSAVAINNELCDYNTEIEEDDDMVITLVTPMSGG